jgi:hypothetical protein
VNDETVFKVKMRVSAILGQYFEVLIILALGLFPLFVRGHFLSLPIALVAIGVCFFLIQRIYGTLEVRPESLLIGQGAARRRFAWTEIAEIKMLGKGKRRRVGLRLFGRNRFTDVFRRLAKIAGGYQIVIHDVYEQDIGEIERALLRYMSHQSPMSR